MDCHTLDYEKIHEYIQRKSFDVVRYMENMYVTYDVSYQLKPLKNKIEDYFKSQNLFDVNENEINKIVSIYGELFNISKDFWFD